MSNEQTSKQTEERTKELYGTSLQIRREPEPISFGSKIPLRSNGSFYGSSCRGDDSGLYFLVEALIALMIIIFFF